MKIAVDAMGGDHAPEETVKGATEAARRGTHIILVGRQAVINPLLEQYGTGQYVSVVDAPDVIGYDEVPTRAVRRKTHSSIVVGMNLLKHGEASGFVSAGNTGAVVASSIFMLGKARGVIRPALATYLPTMTGSALLLDIGANSDCKPQFLSNFAHLGDTYAREALRIPRPRVGLLSNGEEAIKGNRLVRQTHKILKGSKLNFVGNVEGKDLIRGGADVIVTDGFTGNTVLKAVEGVGELVFQVLHRSFNGNQGVKSLVHTAHFKTAVEDIGRRLDWSEHGGAVLLGVKGTVIVAHGRSRAKAVVNAIRMARVAAERMPTT
ncbi:MAG: phosphate acyltransferase PlsX [Dehalococcoidia bacterium]|nr:phosphate acyltransferase PlsX [Dehalococcoidia bacterium]